jgi:hypothetical protein
VLHNIMAIFTFMGSSILRQDDAYSFQVISKIVDTIIPILVKVCIAALVCTRWASAWVRILQVYHLNPSPGSPLLYSSYLSEAQSTTLRLILAIFSAVWS